MAYSREELLAKFAAEVSAYPTVALRYQAGDPLVLSQMGAMATMLSMISQQIDIESMEAFIKSRDTTVLADATMKGILPFARPARVTLSILNDHASATLNVVVGRRLTGDQGRIYVAETAATIAPGATGTVTAKQMTTRTFSHTVSNSVPFYEVQIPPSTDDDAFISGVLVSIAGVSYPYTPEFSNLAAAQPGFALETDEYRRLRAMFGWKDTFGVQPANGAVIDFIIEETGGQAGLATNATFTFESASLPADQSAKITLASVIFPGSNPLDIQTLREMAQYPSTYDSSAVYLGNFDFLVRRNIFPLRFLSIWNEQMEETVRGASVNNINKLFVSSMMDGPTVSWLQTEINKVIRAADDSYRIQHVTTVEIQVPMTIAAQVSVVHDPAEVESKIREVVLGLYGRDSELVKNGMMKLNRKRIHDELKAKIVALQDSGSDYSVTVPGTEPAMLPEHYRFVSNASLTVTVTQATYNGGLFSH